MGGCCFVGDGPLCWMCWPLLLRVVWVCEWCISSRVCIIIVFVFQMNSVCVVCVWLHLIEVCVCDKGHEYK